MKYNHQRLLRQLMDQGKSQLKIVEYFKGEGYTEDDVISEINSYEQQQHASSAMKDVPKDDSFSMEVPKPPVPQKVEALPAKLLMIFLAALLIVFLTVIIMLVL